MNFSVILDRAKKSSRLIHSDLLREYHPVGFLSPWLSHCIDAFWFFSNQTGVDVPFPVVPDGCSDIIFCLGDRTRPCSLDDAFISGTMDQTDMVTHSHGNTLFGIRFKPGMLSCLLHEDMRELKNNDLWFDNARSIVDENIVFDPALPDLHIIKTVAAHLETYLKRVFRDNSFCRPYSWIVETLARQPDVTLKELHSMQHFSLKGAERYFNKAIGLPPKKFARIMRFQRAHRMLQRSGVADLASVALASGYYDQAHFNRDFRQLVGCSPTSDCLSILYNTDRATM